MRSKMQVTGILIAAMAAGYMGGLISQANTAVVAASAKRAPAVNKHVIGDAANVSVKKVEPPVINEVVRARKFEVVDAEGKVCGSFESIHEGSALYLYDSEGRMRGTFRSTYGDDTALAMYDSAGTVRGLFCTGGGAGKVVLSNSAGMTIWRAPEL